MLGVGLFVIELDIVVFVDVVNMSDVNNWKIGVVFDGLVDKWNNLKLML